MNTTEYNKNNKHNFYMHEWQEYRRFAYFVSVYHASYKYNNSNKYIVRYTHTSCNITGKLYLIREDLGAVKADAAHNGEHSLNEADVEHGLGKLKVSKVAWTLRHPCHACVALDFPVNSPQSRVTEPVRLWLAPLHGLCVFYLNHRHLSLQRRKVIINNQLLSPEICSSRTAYEPQLFNEALLLSPIKKYTFELIVNAILLSTNKEFVLYPYTHNCFSCR